MTARDREVGRRVSALRSGLHGATERFEQLIVELVEIAPDLVEQAEEAKADIGTALDREMRMREQGDTS
jgi:hypothetical protein